MGEQPQGVIGCLPTPNPSRIQEGWEGGSDALWEEGCLLFEDLWSLRNKNKYNFEVKKSFRRDKDKHCDSGQQGNHRRPAHMAKDVGRQIT